MLTFKFFFNYLRWNLFLIFLFFYAHIYIYSEHKRHLPQTWLHYIKESYCLLNKSFFLLVFYTISLFTIGRFDKFNNFINTAFKRFLILKEIFLNWFFYPLQLKNFFYLLSYNTTFNAKLEYNTNFFNTNFVMHNQQPKLAIILNIFYTFFKSLFIPLLGVFIFGSYLIFFYQITFLKQLAIWFVVGNLFFWLFSGFNYFIKRYLYGKFTSAIQRFWKRANMCFWLVEGFLFLLFYYYYLNSSQEPNYMYDYSSLNQEYLLPLTTAYSSLFILAIMFFLLSIFLLKLNHITFSQTVTYIILFTVLVLNIFFIESYQFYYVITTFSEHLWFFDEDLSEWKLVLDSPKLRSKNLYFLLCLIAKYWHFIFIFFGWVFLIMKAFELKKLTYELLSYNLQNFVILFTLNLLTYTQWCKWLVRRYSDVYYFWFYTAFDLKSIYFFITEIKLLITSLFSLSFIVWKNFNCSLILVSFNTFSIGDTFLINSF